MNSNDSKSNLEIWKGEIMEIWLSVKKERTKL